MISARFLTDGAPPQIYNDAKANVKGEERKQVKGIHFHAVLGRVQRYVVDVLGDFGDGAQQREDVEPEVLLSNPERVNVAVGIGGEEPEEGAAAPSPLFLKGRQELVVVLCVYCVRAKGRCGLGTNALFIASPWQKYTVLPHL